MLSPLSMGVELLVFPKQDGDGIVVKIWRTVLESNQCSQVCNLLLLPLSQRFLFGTGCRTRTYVDRDRLIYSQEQLPLCESCIFGGSGR